MFKKSIKLVLLGAIVCSLAVGASFAQHEGHGHAKKENAVKESHGNTKEATMTGEILDLYCFMNHPEDGQGPEHAKCATSCIKKGLPIGLLVDGEVFLIVGKDHESAAGMVADFAGKQSVVTGKIIKHHGMKAIEIVSIKPVS